MSDKEKNDWTNDSGYSDVFHNTMHFIPKINKPQEEYNFPLKTDGELNPEYNKILELLYENDKLKARVKFLEESYYYDGYNWRNRLAEKIEIIKELENK